MGRGGRGLIVSTFAFQYEDLTCNPTEAQHIFLDFVRI